MTADQSNHRDYTAQVCPASRGEMNMNETTKNDLGWLFGALLVGLMWTAPGWMILLGWI